MGAITHQNLLDISQSVVTHSIVHELEISDYKRVEALRLRREDEELLPFLRLQRASRFVMCAIEADRSDAHYNTLKQ